MRKIALLMGWSKVVDSKNKHWIALVTVGFDSLFLWERVGERAWRKLQNQNFGAGFSPPSAEGVFAA